jgi:anti-sigma factor RsiW
MTRDLGKLLADYVDNKLDPETEIEIDGLILRFVDGELDAERTAEIKAAMDANPAVAASISYSIAAAKTVQEQLVPALEALDVPTDPEHEKWLAELIADPDAWGKEPGNDEQANVVVPLQSVRADKQSPVRQPDLVQPTWGAMAASIAALLAIGGGVYLYDLGGDRQREQQIAGLDAEIRQLTEERQEQAAESDSLTRQVTALGIQLNEAASARDDVASQLADAEATIGRLNADQAELTAQLVAANDEVTAALAARDNLEQQIASLDAETRQAIEARVNERDELTRQLAALQSRLDDVTAARDDVTSQLAEVNDVTASLSADRAELAAQLADAAEEVATAQRERDRLQEQIVSLDADLRRATAELVTERESLTSQANALQARLAAAEVARDALDTKLVDALAAIETVDAEKDGLQRELATAATAQVTLQARLNAEIEKSQERVTALESDLNDARAEIAGLNQSSGLLLAETDRLRKEGSWLNQVVGYHRGYAGTMREVEITAKQQEQGQMLTKWLGRTLGRPFTVPALEGLTFVGGRVFFVNGVPTGQIAYHDSIGRLTAFCFSPAPGNQTTELTTGEDGDLNLAYWEKAGLRYVLVGWADREAELKPLAEQLRETYGEET